VGHRARKMRLSALRHGPPRSPSSLLGLVACAAAAVPPALVLQNVARHARNVPYKDHWGHVPFIVEAARGSFKASSLWEQINEHRIPLARLLQGLLALATRWDVRYEVYADFVLALLAFVALAALVRRTLGALAPGAAPWVVLLVSVLHFSLAQGYNWTWGAMMPAYMTTLAASATAWLVARRDGGWRGATALVACAVAGALSFGPGLALLGLVPAALLVSPPAAPLRPRVEQATTAAVIGAILAACYAVGWHPRVGEPPPVFHPDRLRDYGQYLLAYLGGAIGSSNIEGATRWGGGSLGLFVAASAWVWWRDITARPALVPWWVLGAYTIVSGFLAAYGRLDNGLNTALFPRYLPTVSLFAMSVAAVTALALTDLWTTARPLGAAALAVAALVVATAGRAQIAAAQRGWPTRAMRHNNFSRQVARGRQTGKIVRRRFAMPSSRAT